jgi:dihydrofolate synthase/folylpolyglutamate synthase
LALNERFRVDGEDIADAELAHHWERVAAAIEAVGEQDRFGGFEFLFLVAADWFAACGCDCTVWEAGIGGRLDPVRLIEAQRLALTSLDFEHTTLLGGTLAEIAHDKIDAAPSGARLYISDSCLSERAAIEAGCALRGVGVTFVGVSDEARDAPLAGFHQMQNASLALALARDLTEINREHVRCGFAATRWPGRLEVLQNEPLVVVDAGHTPAGIRAALQGFEEMREVRRAVLVCGASHDKEFAAIAGLLAPAFNVIICAAAHHKGAPASDLALHVLSANPSAEVLVAEDVADARHIALTRAGSGGAVYVAGGLFLAAEFRAAHLGRDIASLVFF